MKASCWIHLSSSWPFVRLHGDKKAKAHRGDLVKRRTTVSFRKSEYSDEGRHPLKLLSNRLLILPAFVAIVLVVLVFLGISWTVRAAQFFLPRSNSSGSVAP